MLNQYGHPCYSSELPYTIKPSSLRSYPYAQVTLSRNRFPMDNQILNFDVFISSLCIICLNLDIYIYKYIWMSIGSQLRDSVTPALRHLLSIILHTVVHVSRLIRSMLVEGQRWRCLQLAGSGIRGPTTTLSSWEANTPSTRHCAYANDDGQFVSIYSSFTHTFLNGSDHTTAAMVVHHYLLLVVQWGVKHGLFVLRHGNSISATSCW